MGLETFPGRGGVRVRKGSTRPPAISPELWQSISKKRKQAAIREYERDLADATVAAVATFVPDGAVSSQDAPSAAGPTYTADSEVPRLPREFESSVTEPHREKDTCLAPSSLHRAQAIQEGNEFLPQGSQGLGCRVGKASLSQAASSYQGCWRLGRGKRP